MAIALDAMTCVLAERRETNQQLKLLTNNLNNFTSDPLGLQPLGPGITIGKRPFYCDSTIYIDRDSNVSAQILFDPGVGNWGAIGSIIIETTAGIIPVLFISPRSPIPVSPLHAISNEVVRHNNVFFAQEMSANQKLCCNFFPGAFIIPPGEVLWVMTMGGTDGRTRYTLCYTVGQLR